MAIQQSAIGVTADVRIQVPRNDRGTLVDGARTVLARAEAVRAVERVEVGSVRPDLNTVHADVRAELTLSVTGEETDADVDTDALAECLCEGFGVQRADVRDVRDGDE